MSFIHKPKLTMTREELFNTPHARETAEKSKKRAAEFAAVLKPSKKIWAVVNGLEYLTPETLDILKQRGQDWHDTWPIGEPHYSRSDGYQFVIHTNQVRDLLQIQLRTAQDLLKVTRKVLGKPKKSYVSVKEFCFVNKLPEDEVRKSLSKIPPDFSIK
jgi:hypothetical protein